MADGDSKECPSGQMSVVRTFLICKPCQMDPSNDQHHLAMVQVAWIELRERIRETADGAEENWTGKVGKSEGQTTHQRYT